MRDAVIVSAARAPIDRAYRGSFNLTVNGGSISIGHPYGLTGARLVRRAFEVL